MDYSQLLNISCIGILILGAIITIYCYLSIYLGRNEQNKTWQALAVQHRLSFTQSDSSRNTMLSGIYRSRAVTMRTDDYWIYSNGPKRLVQTQIILSLQNCSTQPCFISRESANLIKDARQIPMLCEIFILYPQVIIELGSHLIFTGKPPANMLPLDTDWQFLLDKLCDLAEKIEQSPNS